MGESAEREHFIPLRKSDLIDLLCSEPGLPAEDQEQFRKFCGLLTATYHHQFDQRLEELKNDYAPFDPDADTQPLHRVSSEERQGRLNALLREFAWLLERANFKHLTVREIEPPTPEASDWNLRVYVSFGAFEHLAIFARGEFVKPVTRKRWSRYRWRSETIQVPSYRRLVLILKLRRVPGMAKNVDTEMVYLKVFKDIPKANIKMLLPTARVQLTKMDRSKIGLPFASGMMMVFWKIVATVAATVQAAFTELTNVLGFLSANPLAVFWGLTTGAIGYGTRSYFAYQGTRQRYNLILTESLYFQNLDSNAGVLFRLSDEAEEQECREAILAYFFLWRYAGEQGWTSRDLDGHIVMQLERCARLKVDFEIGDALQKLEALRLVEKQGERYRVVPIARALEMLDWAWEHCFKFNGVRGRNQQWPTDFVQGAPHHALDR